MLEIERRSYIFKTKEIWFNDYPFDVKGYDGVVFCACKDRIDKEGFSRETFDTLVIDLTADLNEIWGGMHQSSCRYPIRRAQKGDIRININKDYRNFFDMNREFRKAKNLPDRSYGVKFMKRYGTLFTAELNGETLAGQFYLEDESNIRWLVGASRRLNVEAEKAALIGNANRLLTWEAITYAKRKKIREFDLGGIYTGGERDGEKEGINFFKKSFGGRPVTKYIYRRYYSPLYKFAKMVYRPG